MDRRLKTPKIHILSIYGVKNHGIFQKKQKNPSETIFYLLQDGYIYIYRVCTCLSVSALPASYNKAIAVLDLQLKSETWHMEIGHMMLVFNDSRSENRRIAGSNFVASTVVTVVTLVTVVQKHFWCRISD